MSSNNEKPQDEKLGMSETDIGSLHQQRLLESKAELEKASLSVASANN